MQVKGTQGYSEALHRFKAASLSLEFDKINQAFLPFLPDLPAKVLDAGAGVGQNAAALCKKGYLVTAVEPLCEFVQVARTAFSQYAIEWQVDALPALASLENELATYQMILLDGVWHHLDVDEREASIKRFAQLLSAGGVCAISLRNGPAGVGTCVYPSSCAQLEDIAERNNMRVQYKSENQPSQLPNKPLVTWSRMVLVKC